MAQARTFSIRGSSRAGLLLALLLAVATGVAVYAALQQASREESRGEADGVGTSVVVAARDIPAGTLIASDMVRLATVDRGAALPGAFDSTAAVVGQVARIPIYRGEQLIASKLTAELVGAGLTYVVPPGKRAMAVRAEKVVTAGGNVRPGDRVDVLALVEDSRDDLRTGERQTTPLSLLLAQNVEVLAVEQRLQNRPAGGEPGDGTFLDQPQPLPEATVITLALSPEEALRVLLAEERGTIRMAVRPAGEAAVLPLTSVTTADLLAAETSGR